MSAIDIRLSTVESDISAGEAGTWASITNKLGIATYDADQKVGGVLRIGEAEEAITVLEGDNNSIKAQYTLKLNVNDRVAGFGLMLSDDEPSEFAIVADRFIIVDPDIDGNESVPFIVGDIGGVLLSASTATLIVDGSAARAKISEAAKTASRDLRGGATGDDATYRMYAGNASPGSCRSWSRNRRTLLLLGLGRGIIRHRRCPSNNSLFRVGGWDRTILGGPGSSLFRLSRTLSVSSLPTARISSPNVLSILQK